MPSNATIFFWSLLAFLAGVFLRTLYQSPIFFTQGLFFLALIILAVDFRCRKNIFWGVCLGAVALGIWRTDQALEKIQLQDRGEFAALVIVVAEPEKKDDYQKLIVQPLQGGYQGKILVNTTLYPSYEYGQILQLGCQLQAPENKYPKFDYIRYLAKEGIYQICQRAEISPVLLAERQPGIKDTYQINFFKALYSFKNKIKGKIGQIFPQPEGAYLEGLLIGSDSQLPSDVVENFKRTGTSHTIAVSGYNITIIAEFLMGVAIWVGFWRPKAFWLAALGIAFFVLAIGSPSSAVRAAVMGVLVLWASKKGRLSNCYRAIVFSAALMVWFSPLILLYDAGFQLSFLATLGIVLLYAPLAERVGIERDFLELKSILLVSLAAQIGVLGILLYSFESFSLISFVANLVILPAISLIMLLGFLVIIWGFLFLPLGKFFSLPVWLLLHGELKTVEVLAKTPGALLEIQGLGRGWLVGYYFFVVLLVVKVRGKA